MPVRVIDNDCLVGAAVQQAAQALLLVTENDNDPAAHSMARETDRPENQRRAAVAQQLLRPPEAGRTSCRQHDSVEFSYGQV